MTVHGLYLYVCPRVKGIWRPYLVRGSCFCDASDDLANVNVILTYVVLEMTDCDFCFFCLTFLSFDECVLFRADAGLDIVAVGGGETDCPCGMTWYDLSQTSAPSSCLGMVWTSS